MVLSTLTQTHLVPQGRDLPLLMPHVYANNTRAMAFAFGFAQAEDHLEHILLAYRVANGRASEIYGERFVESDTFARIMRHADLASNAYDTLDATTRDLCEGFALGINSRMIERPDKSPAWAEPVRPVDVLAFFHHYLMTMAPFDYPGIYHPPKGTPIANAWALAPSRTKEGKSILVMNPHTDYDGIFQWYEAHLSTRDLNVYGATLYGLPVIMMGHNETLGWALSPNDPDIADKVRKLVRRLQREQSPAILYTSHNMKDIEEVCDRILFLHAGKILASGTSAEIKERFEGKDLDDVFIKVARNEIEALHL
mgnify:CR=1 FL=1